MRFHGWSTTLGLLGGCLFLATWALPAFGEDGLGKGADQVSGTETTTLEAKQLSDAELDEITAGFNVVMPATFLPAIQGIEGIGSPADNVLAEVLGAGGGPHTPATQFDVQTDTLLPAVQLPAVQQ